jgi:2,4-dienoyl-CoA reductase-like NADH-dependent reductase (Old Yellow Enzyme family)
MPGLFDTYTLKSLTLRNRIAVSPMCQYSAIDGVVNDWHLVHLGARASGGASVVVAEATAVAPEGRITQGCAGLWNDAQAEAWSRVARFVAERGAVPGIQLAHAGRKASANRPWEGDDHLAANDPRAWEIVGPSALAFGGNLLRVPRAMTVDGIQRVQRRFAEAAQRALAAGFQWLNLHFAHGYLANSFMSPIANQRADQYGGSFDNRARFPLETLAAVRAVWPEHLPLTVRLGVRDFVDGGMTLDEGIELSRRLHKAGADLIDVSLALNSPDVSGVPWGPGFMVPAARRVREEAGVPVSVGWMIDSPQEADRIIRDGSVDLYTSARAVLAEPSWPYRAASELGVATPQDVLPVQYAAWLKRRIVTRGS